MRTTETESQRGTANFEEVSRHKIGFVTVKIIIRNPIPERLSLFHRLHVFSVFSVFYNLFGDKIIERPKRLGN